MSEINWLRRDIVRSIRAQRPEIIPSNVGDCSPGWYEGMGTFAIPMLESFLWRAYASDRRGSEVEIGVCLGSVDGWQAFHGEPNCIFVFPEGPLSLVYALCHALGIVLPEGGAP